MRDCLGFLQSRPPPIPGGRRFYFFNLRYSVDDKNGYRPSLETHSTAERKLFTPRKLFNQAEGIFKKHII